MEAEAMTTRVQIIAAAIQSDSGFSGGPDSERLRLLGGAAWVRRQLEQAAG